MKARPNSTPPALAALLAACAALLAALAWLWLAPGLPAQWRQWSAPPAQAPVFDDVRQAALHANAQAAADHPATLARPLFMPTRRPMPPAEAASAAAAPPPQPIDQARALGLLDGRVAGVLVDFGGQTRFVRVGEEMGGWTLQAVEGRSAQFVRGGDRRSLELPFLSAEALAAQPKSALAGMPAAVPAQPAVGAAPADAPQVRPRRDRADRPDRPDRPERFGGNGNGDAAHAMRPDGQGAPDGGAPSRDAANPAADAASSEGQRTSRATFGGRTRRPAAE